MLPYYMNMNSPFELNALQRISLFGLDFSFFNLTLYLILAIIVIFFSNYFITKSLSLIPSYWQSTLIKIAAEKTKVFLFVILFLFLFFESYVLFLDTNYELNSVKSMFSMISTKSLVLRTKTYLSNSVSFLKRNYSNQNSVDNLFATNNVIGLDSFVEDSMRHRLIDPIKNQNVSIHQLDIMSQISIKKFSLCLSDFLKNFNLSSFYVKRSPNLAKSQILHNKNFGLQNYNQRSNTIAETTALQASKSNLPYFRSIDMFWNKNMNSIGVNLTGNINPDYACSIVWQNGLYYYYHADLKITTLCNFEKKCCIYTLMLYKIYWIDDVKFSENHVFQGITKIRLETTYHSVIQYYAKMDPELAKVLYLNSHYAFNKFKKTGLASDYNEIPLGTPKFIFISWITNLF